jgi:hypothetical protein
MPHSIVTCIQYKVVHLHHAMPHRIAKYIPGKVTYSIFMSLCHILPPQIFTTRYLDAFMPHHIDACIQDKLIYLQDAMPHLNATDSVQGISMP